MRLLIVILFSIKCFLTEAQICETYNNERINCIDKDSLKQGYWYEYKINLILTTDSFRQNPKAIGFHNNEGRIDIPLAKGYYENDKRIGEWKIYKGYYFNDNFKSPTSHEQTVIYSDSGHFKIIDTFWHFFAKVSNDSSYVIGNIFLNEKKIEINCRDKKCYYQDPFDKKRTKVFAIEKLDTILRQLNLKKELNQSAANMRFAAMPAGQL